MGVFMSWQKKMPWAMSLIAGIVLIGSLFAPWMDVEFTGQGDINGGAGVFTYWGVDLPLNAFVASLLIAAVLAIAGVLTVGIAALRIFRPNTASERLAALSLIGLALLSAICIALICFEIDSDPFRSLVGGPPVEWVTRSGPKIASACSVLIAISGFASIFADWHRKAPTVSTSDLQDGGQAVSSLT
jgi:hypothetical protein